VDAGGLRFGNALDLTFATKASALLGAWFFEVAARSHFLQVKLAFERVKDNIVNIARPVQLEQLRSSSGDRGENHGEVLLLSSNQPALGFAKPRGRARPIAVLFD
jgi:hypothetical protein